MSLLRLTGRTDRKKYFEATGDKHIDLTLGPDEGWDDMNHTINVRMNRPTSTGNVTLWVNGIKACEIVNEKVHCEIGGPKWVWDKK